MRHPSQGRGSQTRDPRYRRFRSRRSPWPLLAALALVVAVGGFALLAPDRLNPVERVSVEETTAGGSDGTDSSGQSEDAGPGGEETGQEAGAREESGDESPEEGRSGNQTGDRAAEDSEEAANEGSAEEQDSAPPPPENKDMALTVPRLDVYEDSVTNSADPEVLHQGAQKLPSTGFPWQDGANPYIAGHRIGYPGTESHNQLYDLPSMQEGDAVYLTDANGTNYEYRVTEIFAVSPSESWVTEPIAGRNMVTLQTCTHTPEDWWSITPQLFEAGPETGRLVVRADRV